MANILNTQMLSPDVDSDVGISSFAVNMTSANNTGAGVLIAPAVNEGPWQGLTVFNLSTTNTLKVNATLVTQTSGVNDREFLVPPNGVYSATFDGEVISQISAIYPVISAAAGVFNANALNTGAILVGTHQFIVNLVNA